MTKYPKLMAAFLACCLVSVVSQVMAGQCPDGSQNPNCTYPGYGPNWDDRFTVGCQMVNNETGATNFTFQHGSLDYAQSGYLMVAFQNAMQAVYQEWKDQVSADPAVDNQLIDWVGRLEADLMKRGIDLNE